MIIYVQKQGKFKEQYGDQGNWNKSARVDSPTVNTTLKNLGALYRRQGKIDAAETLEECAMRSKHASQQPVSKTQLTQQVYPEKQNVYLFK